MYRMATIVTLMHSIAICWQKILSDLSILNGNVSMLPMLPGMHWLGWSSFFVVAPMVSLKMHHEIFGGSQLI